MSTKQFLDYSGLQEVAGNVNTRLKTVSVMPVSASDGAIRLYVGETGEFTKGHIYQYSEENTRWVDITPAGGGSGDGWEVVETMPASATEGTVVLFNGHSTVQYAHGGVYRMTSGSWEFLGALVQIVDIPFTLSFDSITAISGGDTKRTLTFTASEETSLTEESFGGITANGVIQGKFWNDIGGSISQIDETTFKVELDTNVADSLGQLAQFPSGSSITIPGFSWIDGITRYVHNAETITISETVVNQKLAFNTTGTLDTSTQATVFGISSAYEVPFVLSYQNIPTVTMLDSNYENEVTQSWTPSIVAANDATNLVFTPTTSTALHGDNIAVTSGTLTAVANGVTYTYDFSTDNINLRWGNTTWSFGVYNTFASFTAAPTSANTGSVTCTLNPTGPGATARELAFMANLLPTVTIADSGETKEFSTVAWTQGSIVASGATGVTSVANKLITVTWADDSTTDVDSYGITCSVYVNALSLSATCAYIDHNVTLSTPTMSHTAGDSDVSVDLVASESLPSTLFADYTEVTLRARAVLQGRLITSNATANATASGTTFTINALPDLVDTLDQRALFATGSTVIVGAFEYIDGDDKYIHASQTINVTESLTTQKLAFNATGTIDSSTGVTTFTINASNIVPFVLSTSDTFSAMMLAAGYGSETTVAWTPTVSYGDSDTELVFTPNNSTALHGDNITFANKVLNFVSNGVTYEIDTSVDTLNIRWANTSFDFGTFNNFASFTAVPTSANSGSVTCTLSPTGPGDDQFELDIMALNLPTVTIDFVQCGTVAWTQGQIVASNASGVTIVGGKTIDITWAGGNYSDTDSYGITRNVTFAAKALSATCGYITKTIVLSNPVLGKDTSTNLLKMSFTTDVSTSDTLTMSNSDYSASTTGILQGSSVTVNSNGSATYNGTTFEISSFANSIDKFNQRVIYPSAANGTVTIGNIDFISGDYEVIHASQTISVTETISGNMNLDFNALYPTRVGTAMARNTIFEIASSTTIEGVLIYGNLSTIGFSNSSPAVETMPVSLSVGTNTGGKNIEGINMNYTGMPTGVYGRSALNGNYFLWGSSQEPLEITSTSSNLLFTNNGVSWLLGAQRAYIPTEFTSCNCSLDGMTITASFRENYSETRLNFANITGNSHVGTSAIANLICPSVSMNGSQFDFASNFGNYKATWSTYSTQAMFQREDGTASSTSSGTVTATIPAINIQQEVPNSEGFALVLTATARTISGTYTYEGFFDDDDCD